MIRRDDRFQRNESGELVERDRAAMGSLKDLLGGMTDEAELYERLEDGRLLCYACGHECKIPEGRAGVCRIRCHEGGRLRSPRGYVAGLACDPIEKKPFYHAFPGRDALSFGMLGCDLHCSYCQNWITSQALRDPRAISEAHPIEASELVDLAVRYDAPVMASTYNEPLITSEWAMEVFRLAQRKGLLGAYISNGNATRGVLEYIRPHTPLYKVDLKSFQDKAYRSLGGQLPHVLRTIRQLHELGFWLEVVTLVVPGLNDSDAELGEMAGFLAALSPDIPWHLTAFHADYKMNETDRTEAERLTRACEIGAAAGLRYVYAGNLPGRVGAWENTRCPGCGGTLIERTGHRVTMNRVHHGRCPDCDRPIPGFWSRDCVVPQANAGTSAYLEAHPGASVEI